MRRTETELRPRPTESTTRCYPAQSDSPKEPNRMRPAKNARQKQAAAAFLVPVMRGILETHRGRPPVAHVARFLETRRSRTPEPNIARHFGDPPELRPVPR